MRDLLGNVEAGGQSVRDDPMRKAAESMKPVLPKRFYKVVTAEMRDGGFAVLLDGKPIRTPARHLMMVPGQPVAKAMAEEWDKQDTYIDPATMPLTRIVNSALDGVAEAMDAVADEIVGYAGCDLLCYRAAGPQGLCDRQSAHWDPVLNWVGDRFNARFLLAEGVMFIDQPQEAVDSVRQSLKPFDPIGLAALHTVTSITGSVLLALALAHGAKTPDEIWSAAHVDDDWNIEKWGEDEEAQRVRLFKRGDFDAAALILSQSGKTGDLLQT